MFKKVDILFPGFKYETCYMQELTIAQVIEVESFKDDDMQSFLYFVEKGLRNQAGDLIINNDYTIENFIDEVPKSYMAKLAAAISEINTIDDEEALEVAKNS